jgi:hypothetical protein
MLFECDRDLDCGKIVKKLRLNSLGENVYLHPDGSVERDEDKIIAVQRIFKENYYKPGGKGFLKAFEYFDDHLRSIQRSDDVCEGS